MRASILIAVACMHARPPSPIENAPGAPLATSARGLRPGEAITWSVKTLGEDVGEVDVAVGMPGTLAGHTAVDVATRGEASGLVSMVKYVRAEGDTAIDVESGLPLELHGDVDWGGEPWHTDARFDGARADVTWGHRGEVSQTIAAASDGVLHSLVSAATAIRGWNGAPGETVRLSILGARNVWDLKVRWIGSDTVTVPLGRFPALRIDGVADDGALHADFSLWLTDDSDRVPLRVVLQSDVLTATFEVTSYQAGS